MRLPNTSLASALTPENVPTPPAAAQAPELSPFDTEIPLPPSTSGRTSRPDIRIVFRETTRSQTVHQFRGDRRAARSAQGQNAALRILRPLVAEGFRHQTVIIDNSRPRRKSLFR